MRRYRGIGLICALAFAAAVSGLFLTSLAGGDGLSLRSLTISETARVLGLAVGALALLWCRSVIGTRLTVLAYGLGGLASLVITGVDTANPWKFSLSVPVALLALSLPSVYRRGSREVLVLLALAVVSASNDSRSAAATLLIAAGVLLTQRWTRRGSRASRWTILVRVAVVVVGGFYLIQAAALEGVLGEEAQSRTSSQIQAGGSVIAGGRPELGASFALIRAQPLGYGAGTLASPTNVLDAKQGMSALGYDPNNGYVEQYMFGHGLEVHSLVGDLWIRFGIAGLLLAVAILGLTAAAILNAYSRNMVTGVVLFLGLRTAWDFAFSPFPSVALTLMLALAVVLPRRGEDGPSRDGTRGEHEGSL